MSRQPVGAGPLSHGGAARDRDRASPPSAEAAARSWPSGRPSDGAVSCSPATSRRMAALHRADPGVRAPDQSGRGSPPAGSARAAAVPLPHRRGAIARWSALAARGRGGHGAGPADLGAGAARGRSDERARSARVLLLLVWGTIVGARPGERAAGDALAAARRRHRGGLARRRRRSGTPGRRAARAVRARRAADRRGALSGLRARRPSRAAALAAGAPWELGLGLSVGLGLLLAVRRRVEPAAACGGWNARPSSAGRAGARRGRERGHPAAPVRRRSRATPRAALVLTALGAGRRRRPSRAGSRSTARPRSASRLVAVGAARCRRRPAARCGSAGRGAGSGGGVAGAAAGTLLAVLR